MIDVRLLREDLAGVTAALARRGIDAADVEQLAKLEERRRSLVAAVDEARATQKEASKQIGSASAEERPALIEQAAALKEDVASKEGELAVAEEELSARLAAIPNLPSDAAPDGQEGEGVVLRTVGDKPAFDFDPRSHVDLMEAAGAVDLERGSRVSGSRFAYLKAEGALLEFALVRYALDVAQRHGHVPVIPPVLVREEAMYGTGFLPTDEQQIFRTDERDDLYLVGTSEVPLAALHMDEILDGESLPIRYAGFSTCFRREAGTYGKDTAGIFRVHQFDKVELFSFVDPAGGDTEHERILAIEEEIFTGLGIHYQVVDIPVGDLGASAARKFDLEAWIPSHDSYREVTSCSNTTDYQARRLKCRVRRDNGTELVHTLNGTAIAVGRAIIAIVETHQRADGTVVVPEPLVPHLGTEALFAG
jgi:seryl-tRNA synthetase